MKLLVINGPNLNRLGKRKEEHYGKKTLEEIEQMINDHARELDIMVVCQQSNYEGEIIEWIHASESMYDACIINPAAFTHYSYAIRDAIECMSVPFVEVHMSNIENREEFRKTSVIEPVCIHQIKGYLEQSYLMAMDYLLKELNK